MIGDTRGGQPLIAVDVVPIRFDGLELRGGVAARQSDPYKGAFALPGVLLLSGERLEAAAYRALEVKGGFGHGAIRHLAQIGVFDGPSRDPRDAAISVSYLAVTEPDTGLSTIWSGRDGLTGLPFDHDTIVSAAFEHVRIGLWSDTAMTRALIGDEFSSSAAYRLSGLATGTEPDRGNLHRSLARNPRLEPVGSTVRGPGRPSSTWRWLAT